MQLPASQKTKVPGEVRRQRFLFVETCKKRKHTDGRTKWSNPATSSEQCSRACRDKRTARRAIRRELSEQMSPRGANVESKACQFARKAGPTSNSHHQRTKIVNRARVRAINLKSGVKTKATTVRSKARALTKRVPFRIKTNVLKSYHTI